MAIFNVAGRCSVYMEVSTFYTMVLFKYELELTEDVSASKFTFQYGSIQIQHSKHRICSKRQHLHYATTSPENVFIICTEMGVFFELMQKNPDKKFYSVGHRQFCPNMKKVRIEKVIEALENIESDNYNIEYVNLDEDLRKAAENPLSIMLELAK